MPKRKTISNKLKSKSKFSFAKPLVLIALAGTALLGYFFTRRQPVDVFEINGNSGLSQPYGIAAKLDGTGYFTINASEKINPSIGKGFVAEAWIKPSNSTFTTMGIFDKTYDGNKGGFRISVESRFDTAQNNYRVAYDFSVFESDCVTYRSVGNVINYVDPTQITSWHHLAAVIQTDGKMDIFVDGKHSTSYSNSISNICSTSLGLLIIGAQHNYNPSNIGSPAINYFKGELDEIHVAQYAKYIDDFTPSTLPITRKEVTDFLFHLDGNLADSVKTINYYYGVPQGSGVAYAPDSIVINPTPTPTATTIACDQTLLNYSYGRTCIITKTGQSGKNYISFKCQGDTIAKRLPTRYSCLSESELLQLAKTACQQKTCPPSSTPTPKPTTTPSCRPRPTCLDAKYPCKIADRPGMYCPKPTPTLYPSPSPKSSPLSSPRICSTEYGSCVTKTSTCLTYTDSCAKADFCSVPYKSCPASTSYPSETAFPIQ